MACGENANATPVTGIGADFGPQVGLFGTIHPEEIVTKRGLIVGFLEPLVVIGGEGLIAKLDGLCRAIQLRLMGQMADPDAIFCSGIGADTDRGGGAIRHLPGDAEGVIVVADTTWASGRKDIARRTVVIGSLFVWGVIAGAVHHLVVLNVGIDELRPPSIGSIGMSLY